MNPVSTAAAAPAVRPVESPRLAGDAPGESAPAFRSLLDNAVARVDQFAQDANGAVNRFLAGEGEEVHQMVLDAQRAELAFELFLQVRNKVVQAYQEIMRMQV